MDAMGGGVTMKHICNLLSLTAIMGDTSTTMYFVKAAAEEPTA